VFVVGHRLPAEVEPLAGVEARRDDRIGDADRTPTGRVVSLVLAACTCAAVASLWPTATTYPSPVRRRVASRAPGSSGASVTVRSASRAVGR
jgi:hypothetical protein